MSFDEACGSLGLKASDLTTEELLDFDSELVCCEVCGWWYPSCETDNGICVVADEMKKTKMKT